MEEHYQDFVHVDEEQTTEWTYNEKYHELNAMRGKQIVGAIDLTKIKNGNDLWGQIRHFREKSWWNSTSFIKALKQSGILRTPKK